MQKVEISGDEEVDYRPTAYSRYPMYDAVNPHHAHTPCPASSPALLRPTSRTRSWTPRTTCRLRHRRPLPASLFVAALGRGRLLPRSRTWLLKQRCVCACTGGRAEGRGQRCHARTHGEAAPSYKRASCRRLLSLSLRTLLDFKSKGRWVAKVTPRLSCTLSASRSSQLSPIVLAA